MPRFARRGQFPVDRPALEEQADAAGLDKRFGIAEQSDERRAGAGGNDIGRPGAEGLDGRGVHGDRRAGGPRHFPQERAFARAPVDQMDILDPEEQRFEETLSRGLEMLEGALAKLGESGEVPSEHQARKAGAAAEVDDRPGPRRQQREELGRVEHVAPPKVAQAGPADQVDGARPPLEQARIGLEPRQCFT